MTFSERRAIELEIETLKEQNRMDYELYLESRRLRNEQTKILMDRLRELDERDLRIANSNGDFDSIFGQRVPKRDEELRERMTEEKNRIGRTSVLTNSTVIHGRTSTPSVNETDKYNITVNPEGNDEFVIPQIEPEEKVHPEIKAYKEKDKLKKIKKTYVPIERSLPYIIEYLRFRGKEETTADIQKYVEMKVETHWDNFTSVLKRAMEKSDKIKRIRPGFYCYDEGGSK